MTALRSAGLPALVAALILAAPAGAGAGVVAFSSTGCASFEDYQQRKPPRDPMNPFPPPEDGSVCPAAIWRVNDDGTGLRRLTGDDGTTNDYSPVWDPDGSRFVFHRERSYRSGGWLMARADGSIIGPVETQGDVGLGQIEAWSPDGERILFSSGPGPTPGAHNPGTDLYTTRPDGSDVRRLTTELGNEGGGASYAPDGRIVFTRTAAFQWDELFDERKRQEARARADEGVFVIESDGSQERPVVTGGLDVAFDAAFSPDGEHLAVVFADESGRAVTHHTYTMTTEGSDLRRRTNAFEGSPTWGAGSELIYEGRLSDAPLYEDRRVPVVKLDLAREGAQPVVLTGDLQASYQPDWVAVSSRERPAMVPDVLPPVVRLVDRRSVRPVGLAAARAGRASVARRLFVRKRDLDYVAIDSGGVRPTRVAMFRRTGRRCRFIGAGRLSRPRSCARPLYRSVGGPRAWRRKVARLRPGAWGFRFRVADGRGNVERRPRAWWVRLTR